MSSPNVSTHASGRRISSSRITALENGEIFVFGSNAAGKHRGGAARYAMDHFGAVYGEGHGLQGQSYAIDTMSGLEVIRKEVQLFVVFAHAHPEFTFLVTEIGTGIAGYKPEQVSLYFSQAPTNVALPRSFVEILTNPIAQWAIRFDGLRTRIHHHLDAQLEDRALFFPPGLVERDPLWDASDLPSTEARLRLLMEQEQAKNPLVDEVLRLRELTVASRDDGPVLVHPLHRPADLLVRLWFEQHRYEEIVEDFEAHGGIQMGTVAWAEQIGWIALSRVLRAQGELEVGVDRLLLALEHSPGPWGQAEPDYLLRGLCELAFLDVDWLGGAAFRAEIARLALHVAVRVQAWRGRWYDDEVEQRLRMHAGRARALDPYCRDG